MGIEEIENFELETKAKIYRKCITLALSDDFDMNIKYMVEDIVLSAEEVLDICNYVIDSYGSPREIVKFNSTFGSNNIKKSEFFVDIIEFDRLKYIYEFRQEHGYDKEKCKEFAKFMGISVVDIGKLATRYAVSYLCISKEEYILLYRKNNPNGRIKANLTYNILFDLLLRFDEIDDIVALIEYSKLDVSSLSLKVDLYIRSYCQDKTQEEKRFIKLVLNKKINMYKEYVTRTSTGKSFNELRQENSIKRSIEMVEDYINCEITFQNVTDYCRYYDIELDLFSHSVAILKKYVPNLYIKYKEKSSSNKISGDDLAKEVAQIVSHYILYGVPTENGIRKFDLIDYFAMTNLKLDVVIKECIKIHGNSNNIFSKFLGVYRKYANDLSPSSRALTFSDEICCKKDEDGFPIKGTGRVITNSEIRTIKKVFEQYNIPFSLYKIAIDRIKNGVDLEEVVECAFISNKPKKLIKK